MPEPVFTHDTFISFGDCDPAGIVFYPNFFSLFDRTFHAWLMTRGGQARICDRIGAKGLGLIEANGRFRAPLKDGDAISVELRIDSWGSRALTLGYLVLHEGRVHAIGTEVRGVFVESPRGMVAGGTGELRAILEG